MTKDMDVDYKELFAFVAVVYKVKDEDAAINLANDSPFGLSSVVMSVNVEQEKRLAFWLETGINLIKNMMILEFCLPFGGTKNPDFSHELGCPGMEGLLNKKLIRLL